MRVIDPASSAARRARPWAVRALGVLALAVAGSAGAGGLFLYEVGTEDVGLASAGYSARAQDPSTILTNPAGMTRLAGKQFLLGTQLLYTDPDFSRDSATSSALGTDDGGNPVGFFPGGSGFYTQELSPGLVIGMGLAGNFGLTLQYNDNWVGRYYVREGTLIGASLLPSIAYRLNPKLSVGASINIMYGMLEDKVAINNPASSTDGLLKLEDEEWGWGVNAGLLWEIDDATRVGLTYTSRVDLDFKATTEFSDLAAGLETVLGNRGLLNAGIDLGINVPQTVMLSGFRQLDPQWALLASVGWQDWSRFGQVQVGVDASNPTNVTTDLPFKDTWHGALGAQYQLSEPWRLTFGVAYDSDFQEGSTVSPMLPVNATWRFGVGGQNQVSKSFAWGIAGEYTWGGTLDVDLQGAPPEIGGRGAVAGSFKDVQGFFLSANFHWQF